MRELRLEYFDHDEVDAIVVIISNTVNDYRACLRFWISAYKVWDLDNLTIYNKESNYRWFNDFGLDDEEGQAKIKSLGFDFDMLVEFAEKSVKEL